MKLLTLLNLLLGSSLTLACGHDNHDGKEWTKEELQELEEKWGYEVNQSYCFDTKAQVHLLTLGFCVVVFLWH